MFIIIFGIIGVILKLTVGFMDCFIYFLIFGEVLTLFDLLIIIALAITGVLNPVVGALVHNAGSVEVIINSALLLKWNKRLDKSLTQVYNKENL
ncbi:MAG: hypothetical protein IJZ72_03400 [Oscillospiraceae bacterium]|nr:hypothetical protein [Oscillospiraceae bacterium]